MEFRLCDVLFCDLEVEGKFVSRLVRGVFSYGCKNYYCMFSNHVQGHYLRKEMVVDWIAPSENIFLDQQS